MKPLIILFALIVSTSYGQHSYLSYKACAKYSVLFNAGLIQGSHEANYSHYATFARVHGITNPAYFDPAISWKMKWAEGSTTKERFLGSSTVFAPFTDYYHFSKAMYISMMSVGFTINLSAKQKLKDVLVESLIGMAAQKAGFLVSYNCIYSTN